MTRELKGRVVLITGAAGGLGAALCRRYAAAGARIAAMDLDAVRLDEMAAQLRATGTEALALPADITDPTACKAAVATTLAQFGALDGLINNAGISHRSLLADTDPDVIARVMAVNFFGAANLTQAALAHIVARQGFIVAISSVAGFSPLTGRTGYAASKHALHGFFDSLRTEVEPLGVKVLLVCPSFIQTGIEKNALAGDGGPARHPQSIVGGRSTPETMAEKIFRAAAGERRLLLPDRVSRLSWWVSRLAPRFYERQMVKKLGREMQGRE